MSSASSDVGTETSGHAEPSDPDAVEIDPSRRYVRYKDVLGKGAFKTVYKAFDELDGIEVAWNQIKTDDVVQSPVDLERLHSEVHLLESVKHENIVKFYASWVDDSNNAINIITELFTSGNLRQYRRKHKKVDIKAVKGWARQILAGLCYLHSLKPPIIHRDLKCDNIFINGNSGEVKIGDLGLATIMHKANAKTVIGTPEFMAPELYDEEYNELVDIYSFGMCMLEMVTFEYPYSECSNSAQIFKKVSNGVKPVALSKVKDPEVKAFIEKCLVAACQRLPARDLLNDPFLKLHDSCVATSDCSGSLRDSRSVKKDGSLVDHGTFTELKPNQQQMLSSSCNGHAISETSIDGNIRSNAKCIPLEPKLGLQNLSTDVSDFGISRLVVNAVDTVATGENSSSYQQAMNLEIVEQWKENKFRLRGMRTKNDSISLVLWIKGPKECVKSEFLFHLGSDNVPSIASEIAEHFNLAKRDIQFVTYLIDSLLIHLVPGWKSSASIDHKETACQASDESTHFFKVRESCAGPSQNSYEEFNSLSSHIRTIPFGSSTQLTHDCTPFVQTGVNNMNANSKSLGCIELDELSSESSYNSTFSTLVTGGKLSDVMTHPVNDIVCCENDVDRNCSKMSANSEISMYLNQRGLDLGLKTVDDASTFCEIFRNDCSVSDKVKDHMDEVDEELRIELEVIELRYQRVIDYILNKRKLAIEAAKKRAVYRKQSLVIRGYLELEILGAELWQIQYNCDIWITITLMLDFFHLVAAEHLEN